MAPPRKSTRTASGPRQSTLSFGAANTSKVSKSAHPVLAAKKLTQDSLRSKFSKSRSASPERLSAAPITVVVEKPTTPPPAQTAAPTPTTYVPTTASEKQALTVLRKQLQTYYDTVIATTRLSKPVHQRDLSLEEKIARGFDTDGRWGPCIGISRLNRWRRADSLGLGPPVEVLAVIVGLEMMGEAAREGPRRDRRRAYVDDELATRAVQE